MTTGVAKPLADALAKMWTAVERDNTRFVNLLVQDDDVPSVLDNLEIVVVTEREPRQAVVCDTALPQASILVRVEPV